MIKSKQKVVKCMQKKSKNSQRMSVRYAPVALAKDFPVNAPVKGQLHSPDTGAASFLHYHDTVEFGLCKEGTGLFYIGNRIYHFSAGDVSVIMPALAHIAQSNKDKISGWQFMDIDISELMHGYDESILRLVDSFFNQYNLSGILKESENSELSRLIVKLFDEITERREHYKEYTKALILSIIIEIIRYSKLKKFYIKSDNLKNIEDINMVSPAISYITKHYNEDITMSKLASMCNMSVSSLRRHFILATGLNPFEFLYNARIIAASALLSETDDNICDVAYNVGYRSLSSFNRHFKKYKGVSPSAFKKQ